MLGKQSVTKTEIMSSGPASSLVLPTLLRPILSQVRTNNPAWFSIFDTDSPKKIIRVVWYLNLNLFSLYNLEKFDGVSITTDSSVTWLRKVSSKLILDFRRRRWSRLGRKSSCSTSNCLKLGVNFKNENKLEFLELKKKSRQIEGCSGKPGN